jgi:hypothetical protein
MMQFSTFPLTRKLLKIGKAVEIEPEHTMDV